MARIRDSELQELFENQWEERKRAHKLTEYVFPNHDGTSRIKDFRYSWNEGCKSVGLGYGYRLDDKYIEEWQEKLPAGPLVLSILQKTRSQPLMVNSLLLLVPRAGIEPARDIVPRDFKSLASTKFRHPGKS